MDAVSISEYARGGDAPGPDNFTADVSKEQMTPGEYIRKGLYSRQGIFMTLTFIVIIIILLVVKNFTVAVLIVGLLTNFVIMSTHLTTISGRHLAREGFSTATTAMPGAGAPYFANMPGVPPRETPFEKTEGGPPGETAGYPGSIEPYSEYESRPGHTDWRETARDDVPYGNPFATARISAPQAAGPGNDDDAVASLDGDEKLALQGRSRNDPTRVWAGALRQKAQLSRYVKEELDESENSRWWGQHEI